MPTVRRCRRHGGCERELGNTIISHAEHVVSDAWTANHLAQVMREEKDRSPNATQWRCPALPAQPVLRSKGIIQNKDQFVHNIYIYTQLIRNPNGQISAAMLDLKCCYAPVLPIRMRFETRCLWRTRSGGNGPMHTATWMEIRRTQSLEMPWTCWFNLVLPQQ